MDILELNGVFYHRSNKKWVKPNGIIACDEIQDQLNRIYYERIDITQMTTDEIIQLGDKCKDSRSLGLALKCYSTAFTNATLYEIGGILPRLTSLYRQMGKPEEAIRVLSEASHKFGKNVISVPLLVSGAAAYCDIGDYTLARKCCDRAFASNGGKASVELQAVYGRIKKESPDIY